MDMQEGIKGHAESSGKCSQHSRTEYSKVQKRMSEGRSYPARPRYAQCRCLPYRLRPSFEAARLEDFAGSPGMSTVETLNPICIRAGPKPDPSPRANTESGLASRLLACLDCRQNLLHHKSQPHGCLDKSIESADGHGLGWLEAARPWLVLPSCPMQVPVPEDG